MEKIVLIQIERVKKRLDERDVLLDWTPEVVSHLAKEGYDPYFGARPLKRLIQQAVVNQLSQAILKGEINNDDKVTLTFDQKNNKIIFDTKKIIQSEIVNNPS